MKKNISNKNNLVSTIQNLKIPLKKRSNKLNKKVINYIVNLRDTIYYRKLINTYKLSFNSRTKTYQKRYNPDSLEEFPRYVLNGDIYQRIYYLADLPSEINTGIVFSLTNAPYNLTLSYHIKGTNKYSMLKASKQRLSVLESLQNERVKKGKIIDQEIEKEMNEVNYFINDLIEEKERVFLVGVYALLSARGKKQLYELDNRFQDNTLDSNLLFNTYSFGQMNALNSLFPLSSDTIKQEHILQTSALVNLLPFLSRNISDSDGIFIGKNHYNDSIILLDLFKGRNANINIFGTSGSGKSYTTKLIITRMILRGVKCIIIDPEGEYVSLVNNLKGEIIKFNKNHGINPFTLNNKLLDKQDNINVLKNFFKFFIQKNKYDGARLDKLLTQAVNSNIKNLEEFINLCVGEDFYYDLLQLKDGSLSGIFDSDKEIDIKNNLTLLDISDLKTDEKKIPAMFLLGNHINNLIGEDLSTKKIVFIDEAHKFLVNKDFTNFYIDLVKTARKRNTGIVSITQNVEDFKFNNNSITIITQAETILLLKQSYSSVQYIKNNSLFPLTEQEESLLPNMAIGQSLLIREKEHILIDVIGFSNEHEIIKSNI